MITASAVIVSEMLGTTIMIFLGVASSIVAGQRGSAPVIGAAGWACAVFTGASVADASGAHLNPAITLAQAIAGRTEWSLVPAYLLGESIGSVLGAVVAAVVFWSTIDGARERSDLVGWFATSTTQPSRLRAGVAEALATAVLVIWVLNPPRPSIEDGVFNFGNSGLGYAGVALVIFVLSLGAGSTTGAALNPFRDLGPRLVYTLAFRTRGFPTAEWRYAPVTMLGPLAGAAAAALPGVVLTM